MSLDDFDGAFSSYEAKHKNITFASTDSICDRLGCAGGCLQLLTMIFGGLLFIFSLAVGIYFATFVGTALSWCVGHVFFGDSASISPIQDYALLYVFVTAIVLVLATIAILAAKGESRGGLLLFLVLALVVALATLLIVAFEAATVGSNGDAIVQAQAVWEAAEANSVDVIYQIQDGYDCCGYANVNSTIDLQCATSTIGTDCSISEFPTDLNDTVYIFFGIGISLEALLLFPALFAFLLQKAIKGGNSQTFSKM
jgi:hypothetical protein